MRSKEEIKVGRKSKDASKEEKGKFELMDEEDGHMKVWEEKRMKEGGV